MKKQRFPSPIYFGLFDLSNLSETFVYLIGTYFFYIYNVIEITRAIEYSWQKNSVVKYFIMELILQTYTYKQMYVTE